MDYSGEACGGHIRRFTEIGLPPVIIHFNGIFHEINHRTPMAMEPPIYFHHVSSIFPMPRCSGTMSERSTRPCMRHHGVQPRALTAHGGSPEKAKNGRRLGVSQAGGKNLTVASGQNKISCFCTYSGIHSVCINKEIYIYIFISRDIYLNIYLFIRNYQVADRKPDQNPREKTIP